MVILPRLQAMHRYLKPVTVWQKKIIINEIDNDDDNDTDANVSAVDDVVELFRVVGTTENILLVFCRLGNSRISSFREKVFNSPALSEREAKYVSFV